MKDELGKRRAARFPADSSSGSASPRALAVEPDVILMDEPAAALDPIATTRIEDLMRRAQARLHDRDRHAQHAAGGARCGLHCHSDDAPRPVRGEFVEYRDTDDLHGAEGQAHGRLHHGPLSARKTGIDDERAVREESCASCRKTC